MLVEVGTDSYELKYLQIAIMYQRTVPYCSRCYLLRLHSACRWRSIAVPCSVVILSLFWSHSQ